MTIRPFTHNYLVKKLLDIASSSITFDTIPDSDQTTMADFLKHVTSEFILSVRGEVKYGYEDADPVSEEAYFLDKDAREALLSMAEKILDTINEFKPRA